MGLKTPKLSPRGPREGLAGPETANLCPRAMPKGDDDGDAEGSNAEGGCGMCVGGGNKKRSKEGNKKGGGTKKEDIPWGISSLCAG